MLRQTEWELQNGPIAKSGVLPNCIRYCVSFTDDDPKNGNRSIQNLFNVAEKISVVYFNKDTTSGEEARDLTCIC